MVCSSVFLLLMLFEVLRGVKLMSCFTKVMIPPPFLCVLSVLCVLYCGIMGVLWWLASFVSCMYCCYIYVVGFHGVCQFYEFFCGSRLC